MCGRIRQAREVIDYGETIRANISTILDEGIKYNVPPGTRPIVLHRLEKESVQASRLFWGYKPPWYKRGPVSNARLATILKGSPFWNPLLARRIILPADGWFEWTGSKGAKQPWYISPKDGAPILIAGLTAWLPGREILAETGFAVITDDAAGGMVDIHDRRPVCLTPDDAEAWLDPFAPADEALQILSTPRPESAFQWWKVSTKVGNSRYQLPDSNCPVS
ncbi:MAG TPA: SOS response-associated peptidase [Pusillimonas sp.]|uniref:SOS response-associated peptidase n=1 Tax=unclassified Pusillimonas TaxID=2640016 RepID=UPI002628E308|nr:MULTISPECIES: SOS response-associated peptidase [unclassified Pusillimonas]HLU18435.1 SOS response-associated peptidase [Pusillimonas sp.]